MDESVRENEMVFALSFLNQLIPQQKRSNVSFSSAMKLTSQDGGTKKGYAV
jgi:hypothetical protein